MELYRKVSCMCVIQVHCPSLHGKGSSGFLLLFVCIFFFLKTEVVRRWWLGFF